MPERVMHLEVFIHDVDYDSVTRLQNPRKAVKIEFSFRWHRMIARILDNILTWRKLALELQPDSVVIAHAFQDNIVRASVVRWELVAVLRRTYPAQD